MMNENPAHIGRLTNMEFIVQAGATVPTEIRKSRSSCCGIYVLKL